MLSAFACVIDLELGAVSWRAGSALLVLEKVGDKVGLQGRGAAAGRSQPVAFSPSVRGTHRFITCIPSLQWQGVPILKHGFATWMLFPIGTKLPCCSYKGHSL